MTDLRYTVNPATRTEIPRPKRAEGQWALGLREPLNGNEQQKKDDSPLNVRDRIVNVYSKRGFDSIDPAGAVGSASTPRAGPASTAARPARSSRTTSTTGTS